MRATRFYVRRSLLKTATPQKIPFCAVKCRQMEKGRGWAATRLTEKERLEPSRLLWETVDTDTQRSG
ncbi:hypothetical protein KCP73_06850 [Salmonella enterica subsp. enterica]|nr:hypothetical protein KCP73_06850 [Salmonella enterica subsp. enterica]